MIKEAINKLVNGEDLSYETVEKVMNEIMSGETPNELISSYLVALRMKGETIDEISGSAMGMRNNGIKLEHNMDVLEIVGTGGDEAFTFNISTTSAIVAAAAGCKVAKHGNRSVSSKSGAADVLEALGVDITIKPDQSKELLDKIGICFLLEILGVYDEALVEPLAEVLIKLGVKKGMVVFGQDVMDEITLSAKTTVCEIRYGKTNKYEINPEDYGFKICSKDDLVGGDAVKNAEITREILNGKKGPKTDAVLLNAGACIYMTRDDVTYKEAINIARQTIESGKAKEKLEQFIEMSNSFK